MKDKLAAMMIFFIISLVVLFSSTACRRSASSDGEQAEAMVPTPTPSVEEEVEIATPTPTPAPTPSPEPTAPVEVEPEVKAQARVNLNLRQGPGTQYALVGSLPVGAEIRLVGRNEDSSWLVAEDEARNRVWLSSDPELTQVDPNSVADLPVVSLSPAPLAYDASDVNVNNVLNLIPLVIHNPDSFTCASQGGLNNLISLAEGNVIGPHSGDFVHPELGNVLFRYTNGSLVLIRENPNDRFADGSASLPLETALRMFQSGELVWTGTLGEWPARGVTGCDQSATP